VRPERHPKCLDDSGFAGRGRRRYQSYEFSFDCRKFESLPASKQVKDHGLNWEGMPATARREFQDEVVFLKNVIMATMIRGLSVI